MLQGGAVFEVFSGQGNDPAARWRLCGGPAAVHKVSLTGLDSPNGLFLLANLQAEGDTIRHAASRTSCIIEPPIYTITQLWRHPVDQTVAMVTSHRSHQTVAG